MKYDISDADVQSCFRTRLLVCCCGFGSFPTVPESNVLVDEGFSGAVVWVQLISSGLSPRQHGPAAMRQCNLKTQDSASAPNNGRLVLFDDIIVTAEGGFELFVVFSAARDDRRVPWALLWLSNPKRIIYLITPAFRIVAGLFSSDEVWRDGGWIIVVKLWPWHPGMTLPHATVGRNIRTKHGKKVI